MHPEQRGCLHSHYDLLGQVEKPSAPNHQGERGMALLTAVIFISVSLMALAALSNRHLQQRMQVDNYQTYLTALDGMEGALDEARTALESGNLSQIGLADWSPVYDDGRIVLPSLDDNGVNPKTLFTNPEVEYIAYLDDWSNNGQDNNGDGEVDSAVEQGMFSIHVASRFNGMTRESETVYAGEGAANGPNGAGVWQNAIFARVGQTGGKATGNASIHGSVHILGEGLLEGDVAMHIHSNVKMQNHYDRVGKTLPDEISARIPSLPTVDLEGEDVETMHATLRIRNGLMDLGGNGSVGNGKGKKYDGKPNFDGVYVTDGFIGHDKKARVFSDNGHETPYDLEDSVSFPALDDPWEEPDGSQVEKSGSDALYSYDEYFSLLVGDRPETPDYGVFKGDFTIDSGDKKGSLYWNATTETYLTGKDAADAAPNANDDYLKFNAGTGVLEANGQIRINGDLTITGGKKDVVNFSGKAAILADGDIEISTDFLSCNNGNPNDTANSFPENNLIGFMATNNIHLGEQSHAGIMGAFYAQNTLMVDKNSNMIGSLACSYFDMSNQNPRFFQVMDIANHLPYGMVGNVTDTGQIERIAWRELGVS